MSRSEYKCLTFWTKQASVIVRVVARFLGWAILIADRLRRDFWVLSHYLAMTAADRGERVVVHTSREIP